LLILAACATILIHSFPLVFCLESSSRPPVTWLGRNSGCNS
jgi:hypothetical protein